MGFCPGAGGMRKQANEQGPHLGSEVRAKKDSRDFRGPTPCSDQRRRD